VQEKINILLVDDQPSKLMSYKLILEELGENLIGAASSREALDQLLRNEIAVILMDVQMPELDGFELAAMIREHPRFERTAIIFVSAIHLSDFDQLKGYAAGAVDYVSVPVVPELLRAKVRVYSELYRKSRQLERLNEELEERVAERTAQIEATAQRLRASEQRRSLALVAGSMGSWDWNVKTGDHVWDEGQYQICDVDGGFRPDTRSINSLLHPEDRAAVRRAARQALRTGEKFHAEFRIRRPSGEIRWCVAYGVPLVHESGQFRLVSGVTVDITGRKLAEQSLASINEELERRIEERTHEREVALAQLFEAQKMDAIGHLTGGVAHDFNNLLMAISGGLEIVRKRLTDPGTIRLIENAIECTTRGAALTKRLLAFARRQELNPVATDVTVLFDGIRDLLCRAVGPTVRLTSSIPESLPSIKVDPNQLELALLNLAVNARDAMPDGGSLDIAADFIRGPEGLKPGEYVCLAIADTGVGMNEATLARAAEPFFTTKEPGRGTGLGLSMVHGMAAQLGGALQLSSRPGAGTVARLFLPVADGEATNVPARPQAQQEPGQARVPQLQILVVDDDALVRVATAAMLNDLGHTVFEAESGAEAVRALADIRRIDLVISDYAMPGMNGADLIRHIRTAFPQIMTIMATGYAEAHSDDLRIVDARLPKPFTQSDLDCAIAQALAVEKVLS
jgi:CheY-like chemotaxis protein